MPFDPATPLQVEELEEGKWRLLADLKYQGKTDAFTVERGFETNFASVPRVFTWLVPTSGAYTKATVLHDYLCRKPGFPRNDADGIFRRAMRELGVPTVRRYVMWGAVRIASLLQNARAVDVIGIILLALMMLPIGIPGAAYVLASLVILFVVELIAWAVLVAIGRKPSSGRPRFWWS